jgi:hypothetical protein
LNLFGFDPRQLHCRNKPSYDRQCSRCLIRLNRCRQRGKEAIAAQVLAGVSTVLTFHDRILFDGLYRLTRCARTRKCDIPAGRADRVPMAMGRLVVPLHQRLCWSTRITSQEGWPRKTSVETMYERRCMQTGQTAVTEPRADGVCEIFSELPLSKFAHEGRGCRIFFKFLSKEIADSRLWKSRGYQFQLGNSETISKAKR